EPGRLHAQPGGAVGTQPDAVPAGRGVRVGGRAAPADRRRDPVRPGGAVRRGHLPAVRAGGTPRVVDRVRPAEGPPAPGPGTDAAGVAGGRVGPARILGGADPGEPRGADGG